MRIRIRLADFLKLMDGKYIPLHRKAGVGYSEEIHSKKREILQRYGLSDVDIPKLKGALRARRYRIVGGVKT